MKKITKDGRTILAGRDYQLHKLDLWNTQGGQCSDCQRYVRFEESVMHHAKRRGMSASKRDDLDPANSVMHYRCHSRKYFEKEDLAARKR